MVHIQGNLFENKNTVTTKTCLSHITVPGTGTDHDQQHCYHHDPTVKPEAATAVVKLLMMGVRTPETR